MNGEVSSVGRWVLVGALAFAVGSTLGVAPEASAAAKKKEDTKTYKQVAQVKVEIKQESGKVVKQTGEVDFGQLGHIEFAGDDHTHKVSLQIARDSDSSSEIAVTVGYDVDGQPIIAPYSFDTKVKKREVIAIEGGLAIALTVTPKKVAVDTPPEEGPSQTEREDESKIVVGGDNNDPLGGLE